MSAKKIILLTLVLIIFVSGCTITPSDALLSTLNINVIEKAQEQMDIVASVPSFVREGKSFTWSLEVTPDTDINNLAINVHDRCPFFTLAEDETDTWEIEELLLNRTKSFKTTYNVAEGIEFEQPCTIRFLAEYDGQFLATQAVNILNDFEYENHETAGTLSDYYTTARYADTPLKIEISFDEGPPFLEDEKVLMYLDYSYSGSGLINKLEAGSVEISFPDNLILVECDDYAMEGERLLLDSELTFFSKKAKRSTCEFTAGTAEPISIGSLRVNGTYHYKLPGEIDINIRKR